MEQQIYSKEFLGFVSDVTTLEQFTSVLYNKSPNSICDRNNSQETQEHYENLLSIMMKLYNSVMTHSTENASIKRFTENMIKI